MPRRIAFLIFDGFQILDAAGPIAVFEIAGRYCEGSYALEVIAAERGLISSSANAAIAASACQARASYDTLIVAGGDGTRTAFQDERILKFVRRAAGRARRVASVCSGAFHSGGRRPARRAARDDALVAHSGIRAPLSQSARRAGPHPYEGWADLDIGRDHGRHRSGARACRRGPRRGDSQTDGATACRLLPPAGRPIAVLRPAWSSVGRKRGLVRC